MLLHDLEIARYRRGQHIRHRTAPSQFLRGASLEAVLLESGSGSLLCGVAPLRSAATRLPSSCDGASTRLAAAHTLEQRLDRRTMRRALRRALPAQRPLVHRERARTARVDILGVLLKSAIDKFGQLLQ